MPSIPTDNELLAHNIAHARNHQGVLSNHENRSTNSLTMNSSDYSTACFLKLDQYYQSLLSDRRKPQSRVLSTTPTGGKKLLEGLSTQLKVNIAVNFWAITESIFCTVSHLLTLVFYLHLSLPSFSKILLSLSFI